MSTLKTTNIQHPSAVDPAIVLTSAGNFVGAGLDLIVNQSLSSSASVSINNCFTSAYKNYRIVLSGAMASVNGITIRLRVGGVDNSTANSYTYQRLLANSTTVSGSRTQSNIAEFASIGTLQTIVSADVTGVANATSTGIMVTNSYPTSGAAVEFYSISHDQTTAYDGMTFTFGANFSGNIAIYGYRN